MKRIYFCLVQLVLFFPKIFKGISPFTFLLNVKTKKRNKIKSGTRAQNLVLGKYSFIGRNCLIMNSTIGNYCSVSDNVAIGLQNHDYKQYSTHPSFGKNSSAKRTIIGNDVWIGYNALIIEGVKIGNGAVIGAGAVVTKDIPDFAVAVGTPAKVIKFRFGENEIKKINKSNWWSFNLKQSAEILGDLENEDITHR